MHTASRLMPSWKLDWKQGLCCKLSPHGTLQHMKAAAACGRRNRVGVGLTGTRTAAPMEERAVSLLEARLAPTHAQVSSRDANVRKGFARITKAGKYVLHIRPAMQREPFKADECQDNTFCSSATAFHFATWSHLMLTRDGCSSFELAQSSGYLQGLGQVQFE